ncbi:putative glycosyl transferase [Calothrix sp. NIES-4071]|nr:putative glycosyl transferase [Calothrix sp. NIES-4071]BAZ58777.1 putative glycosyl transferase [Calothrix sp. NIES-4105]
MSKLVSIIIPCYNASRWITEAIDSCLHQTYSNIEIIIIDDGSTDNSLEIIQSYAAKNNHIIWRHIPHTGGNHARNVGLSLSQAEYIQFLDADDYILPEKIKHQVNFLESTGADVVYGDWCHQYHYNNGSYKLGDTKTTGQQTDILESLLGTWWVAVAALLYRHEAIKKSVGWDETLSTAQDRDFIISVVMCGALVMYQPGCYSIYRRYGNVTVSTVSRPRWIMGHCLVLEKAERKLAQNKRLSNNYRRALAAGYFDMARYALFEDYSLYLKLLDAALKRCPDFQGNSKNGIYHRLRAIIGFRRTEKIVCLILIAKKYLNSIIETFASLKTISGAIP